MSGNLHRFFCPDPSTGTLSIEESAHALKSLRLRPGDDLELLDGMGTFFRAKVSDSKAGIVAFDILKKEHFATRSRRLHIAIAPTKNLDRFLFFAEKATELGVAEISPVICQNSERRTLSHEKIRKTLISALKQSRNPYLPIVNNCEILADFIRKSTGTLKCIAHCRVGQRHFFKEILHNSSECLILIGPEGDFTAEEINLAVQNEFHPVTLSDSVLRTETAGIAACCAALL